MVVNAYCVGVLLFYRLSALHHAALNGNVELIALLLESQAVVDIKDQNGTNTHHLLMVSYVQ